MNPILLKAILSMDAYNRGYDAAIDLRPRDAKGQLILDGNGQPLASDTAGIQIGFLTIYKNKGDDSAKAISFYGISYQLKDATGKVIDTIISYRGTDNLGVDLLAGYGVGGGNPKEAQAQMAFDFYNVVSGGGDPTKANISLTGHSLGGGLAGLVGAVYGKSGTLFDNMAFEGAVQNTKVFSDPASGSLYDATFKQKVYGNLAPWNPTISSASNSLLQTYYTNGEFLAANRFAQQTPQHGLDIGSGVTLPGVDSGLFGDNLHSIATLTILLYADASTGMGVPADWKNAAKYFWPVMYDDSFAAGIGNASSIEGTLHDAGKYSAIVRTAIAYSAIDEGARIYGDTGIRALYNDANELGKALSLTGVSSALTANATDISKAFVQYAGQLALNKVLNTSATASVLDGVLKLADVANNHSITIDFTDGTWSKANNGSAPAAIVARDSLMKDVLGASSNVVHAEMKRGWSDITAGTDPNAAIDRVVFATLNTGASVISNNPTGKATLFVGGTGADNITGSDGRDLILGNGGGDQIHGGAGNDIFLGGAGNDSFYGDDGSDSVSYGKNSGRVIVTMNGSNGTVDDGYNTTDTLNSIENLTLSNYADTLKLYTGPAQGVERHFEGGLQGNGQDTADYGNSYGMVIDNSNVAKGAAPVIWNSTGTGRDILTGFEKIITGNSIILPDLTVSTGAAVSKQDSGHSYDYSAAKSAANIDVGYFMDFQPFKETVTIGGITQFVSLPKELHGTNFGDTIQTGVSYGAEFTIHTGFGNDIIHNLPSAGSFTPGRSIGRTGLNIVYTGGNDVIDNGYTLHHIYLWEGIRYEDLTFGYTYTEGGDLSQLIIGVQNYGALTINNMYLASNPWMEQPIILESGGYLSFSSNGLVFNGTPATNNLINGTWGVDKIIGHANDEIFYGLGDNDTIDGRDGNDTLYGGGGDDKLIGGNGNDTLDGGFDNDTLIGGAGNNTLIGGDGFDIADYSAMTSGIIVNMTAGSGTVKHGTETDTLTSVEKIIGTIYNDTANGGAGDDGFALSSGKDMFTDAGGVDTIKLASGQSLETLSFSVSALDLKIIQTAGVNETTLTGQMGADASKYIENLQYADGFTIPLSQYKTWIKGTTAAETINGDAGGVILNDVITGGAGNDVLNGLGGNDILSGDAGNDTLNGGAGNDRIEGGSGNDILSGNEGVDDLYGGTGDDIFIVKAGDGTDTLHEMIGEGIDTLKITGGILPANVQMWGDAAGTYIKYTSNDMVFIPGAAYATLEKIVFDNGTVWSAATAFNMVDTDESHSLAGWALADMIDGRGGDDTIFGYDGNDTLTGGIGSDALYGGKGDDTYIFRVGDTLIGNQDQIVEQENEGTDIIKLVGVLPTDVQKTIDGNGVVAIKYSTTDQLSFGSIFDSIKGYVPLLEKIILDNGTTIDLSAGFAINDVVGANASVKGTVGGDSISALDGNDAIYGYAGNDTLTGGTGSDYMYGGTGDDTYVFKVGDSSVSAGILDYVTERSGEGLDTIKLTGGILPLNVTMWADSLNLYIQYSANDQIIIPINRDYNTGSILIDTIEKIVFDNGTTWDLRNGLTLIDSADSHSMSGTGQNDVMDGKAGDDNLNGGAGNDILTGGLGNDALNGGTGDDTYIFKVGDSASAIEYINEGFGEGTDTIKLTGGILPANVTMWSDSSGYIHVKYSATDEISFQGNDGVTAGLTPTVEKIVFDNGTIWNLSSGFTFTGDNTAQYMLGTTGNDTMNLSGGDDYIYAYAGNDTLNGGVGIDNLNGGTGDDTYIFKAGESLILSPDYITENLNEGVDTIKLMGGILPANVQMWADMYSLHLRYSANDEIIIQSSYDSSTGASLISSYVEKIAFDNGTVLDLRLGLNMNDTNDSHYIYGSIGNDIIDGKGGDDYIYAYAGNDTLTGGIGQDNLYGGIGDDTYIFKVGDASLSAPDYVSENSNEGVDTIKLTGGVLPSNVILTVSYYSLTIQYSANDSIVVSGDVDSATNSLMPNVEKIVFDNGTVWDFRNGITTSDSNLSNEVHGSMLKDIINGNGGNDTLYGEGNNDILNGGAGNDILYGGAGDDQYIYSAGSGQGNDIIHEENGDADTIVLGAGYTSANVTLTRSGQYDLAINSAGQRLFLIEGQFYTGGSIETLKYGDGTTLNLMTYSHTVNGTASDDTLYGVSIGGGGDKLNGLDGNDYIYAGDNNDIVAGGNGNDFIFGEDGNDILSGNAGDDYIYAGTGDDTVIYDSGSDIFVESGGIDTIKITNTAFTSANMTLVRPSGNMYDLEVLFNGVHAFTIQSQFSPEQSFENIVFANGSSFNLANVQYTALGTVDSDYIYGISYGGNPNDIIKGNAGDDYIYALNGDDIITGGIGNDTLDGGYGSDIYNYNSGDGLDVISDANGIDLIQIGAGYTKADLSWQRDVGTNNMILFLKGAQVMTLQDQFVVDHQIETVKFADGSSQTLVGLQISTNGTAGDDNLSGIDSNASQNDNINGFAGNDYIYGYEGNDTLTGGVGNDNIDGGNGNDIFVYNKGDGVDVITDSSGSDTIQVGAGYTKTDLTWSRIIGTYDLSLNLKGVKVITIQNHFMDGYAVENVKFSDGTTYALTGLAITSTGTSTADYLTGTNITNDTINGLAGDDYISSYGGNDILNGGVGQDYLYGGTGDDTYIFKAGDSTLAAPDYIIEYLNEGVDTIKLTGGILPANIQMWGDTSSLHIRYSTNNEIIVQTGYDPVSGSSAVEQYIEKIAFDSGTVWDLRSGLNMTDTNDSHYIYGSMNADIINGMGGDDLLFGYAGNDILNGGVGLDGMYGGLGDDTYVFKAGDSPMATPEYIYEFANEGIDTIKLTGGILPANVQMWVDGSSFHVRYSANDEIVIQNGYDGTLAAGNYIEKISFENGTILDLRTGFNMTDTNDSHTMNATNQTDIIDGKGGDDNLYAFDGNDTLIGGTGQDYLAGGLGDDIYIFKTGDSPIARPDTVYEGLNEGIDTIKLTGGILPSDVRMWSDRYNLYIRYSSTDQITVLGNQGYSGANGTANYVEKISFDNGVVWDIRNGLILTDTDDGHSIVGSNVADIIDGRGGNDSIQGFDGNDILNGGAGDDYIYGGNANDIIDGGAGNDYLGGDAGIDTVTYASALSSVVVNLGLAAAQNTIGAGTDTLYSLENLTGSAYNDTLTGDANANIIQGGAGNDILNGMAGSDTASYADSTAAVAVNLGLATAQNTVGAGTDTLTGFENLAGSVYNDTLTGDANANIIQGGAGNDIMNGMAGSDTASYADSTAAVIVDLWLATAQNTVGAGTDTLTGFENLTGSAYNDTLTGDANANIIQGGAGNDIMNGMAGSDTASYADSTAAVTVNLGVATAQNTVGAGTDTLTGFENLAGSAYNDTLTGDANANIIQGGAGNDFLYGAGGLDSLIGGAGADTFIFKALTAMSVGAVTISDFVANDGDVIDISDILAGHYDPISQSINDFVQMQSVGVNTIIKVDLDGAGTAQGWTQIATVSNATLDLDIMMATKHLDVT